MKDAVQFREALADEAELVASLHVQSWRSAYRDILSPSYLAGEVEADRRALWRDRFAAPGSERRLVLLAQQGAAPAGFACVLLDEDAEWGALLNNLHVMPRFKGTGVGSQLLRRAGKWVAQREPGRAMHLFVFEANAAARRFYDARGGEVVERVLEPSPDGIERWVVRYVWREPETIL